jgi:hypothetical protein
MENRTRGIVAGACVVVAIAALWWVLRTEHGAKRGDAAPGGRVPARVDHAQQGGRDLQTEGAPGEGVLRPTPLSDPDEAAAVVVTVLADEKPAAGVACEWAPIDCRQARKEESLDAVQAFAPDAARAVTRVRSDERGWVRIEGAPECTMIRGALDDLAGELVIDRRVTARPVLRLVRALRAIVVDGSGAPQPDVPVSVQQVFDWGARDLRQARTGPDGIASFPADLVARREEADVYQVAIGVPLPAPVVAAIPGPSPPPLLLRLVMPPTGRIEVRLVGKDGAPWSGRATVFVAPTRDDSTEMDPDPEPRMQASRASAEGGSAVFAVGLRMKLEVHARPADRALRVAHAFVDGPRAAGDKVEARLACGDLALVVSGRLVGRDGKVVGGHTLVARLPESGEAAARISPHRGRRSARAEADAGGHFSFHFDVDPASISPLQMTLSVMRWVAMDATSSRVVRKDVEVALPETARAGSADVGDVVVNLADEPVAAASLLGAGIVIDGRDAPVGAADVEVFEKVGERWKNSSDLPGFRASTLADGKFTVEGTTNAAGVGVSARKHGWISSEIVPFQRGARDVRIRMTPAGGVEGAFTGLEGAGNREVSIPISIYVVGDPARIGGDDWENERGERRVPIRGGRFMEETLGPGTCRVDVRVDGEEAAVVSVPDVVIRAGEINRDPRLQKIDVRKFLALRTITVIDEEEGRPIAEASVFTPSLERPVHVRTDATGQALLATKQRAVDVVVVKKGFRSANLAQVTGDATARIRKASPFRVTVKLSDDVALLDPPLGVSLKLEWICGLDENRTAPRFGDPRSGRRELRFGRDRVAEFLVDDPGFYKARLSVTKELANGRSWSEIESDDPAAARIRVEGAETSATVTATAARISEAIANLAK